MHVRRAALSCAAILSFIACPAAAQHRDHRAASEQTESQADHSMWSAELGAGWRLLGMAQAFPIITFGAPGEGGSPLNETAFYLTQPTIMANLESPGSRITLRGTVNFEGVTQEDGELTFGGWGEGFIDKRHPHTLLHELMLSLNFFDLLGGEASISGGRGFAPYGTDDPMARPGLKYPTNHHLSQILERWTINGVFLRDGWSAEAGLFAGAEPEGPYDLSNTAGFGSSWSVRLAKRWGPGSGPAAAWEASTSYGSVAEEHDAQNGTTQLWNVALRHDRAYDFGEVYGLVEFSRSDPEHEDGYYSALAEMKVAIGIHQPYLRFEYATRPEYSRDGAPGTESFFRYDHDNDAIGATRWTIVNAGYSVVATRGPLSIRPFINAQFHHAALERGPPALAPEMLFGTDRFWSLSLGAQLFFGGDAMRMGGYGVLDPMTTMSRMMSAGGMGMDGSAHD